MRPIDVILIVVALSMTFMLWRVITGKKRKAMQTRIARIQSHRPEKAKEEGLRRANTELTSGLIYRLTKPLPDFKRLGDQL